MNKVALVFATILLSTGLLAGCAAPDAQQAASSASSAQESTSSASQSVNDAGDAGEGQSGATKTSTKSGASSKASSDSAKVPASLRKKVSDLIKNASVNATFEYVDLKTGATYGVGAGQQMVAASMIKLLVLAAFLDQVDQGVLSLDDTYTLKSSDLVGGTGSLQAQGAGAQVTLRQAARLMITESDNVGANIIIDKVGKSAINDEADELGLAGTQLNRKMMQDNGTQNYMTADDAAIIFRDIYEGQLGNQELSALALSWLKEQTDKTGFSTGLPSGVTFAHKTGQLSSPVVQNDGGIVLDDDPYILVAFTEGSTTNGVALMQELAQAVVDAR